MGLVVNTYTSTTTWICPAGVTSVQVECMGAGGNGSSSGGGGSGGDYAKKNSLTVVPGTSYNIVIGGSAASVYFGDGTQVLAVCGVPADGVSDGHTTTGDVTFTGGTAGTKAGKGNTGGGGGGSGASDTSNGHNGSSNSGTTGGAGGAATSGSTYGGGAGGTGGTYNTVPATSAGSATGAGGGGGGAYSGGAAGTGGPGKLVLTYTDPGVYVEHANFAAKPNLYSKVNFALPIAQGMCGCYLFNERGGKVIRDLVGKMGDMDFSSSPAWYPRGLRTSNGTGNATGTTKIKSAFNPVLGDATIRVIHIPNSWPGTYTCIVEAYGASRLWDIFSNGTSITYRGIGGADGSSTNSLTMPVNQIADLVWVRKINDTSTGSTQVHYWYLNGKFIFKETGFSNNSWPTTGYTLTFGGNPSGGGSAYDGLYLKGQMWNRALKPAEIDWAARNPWGDIIRCTDDLDSVKAIIAASTRQVRGGFGMVLT